MKISSTTSFEELLKFQMLWISLDLKDSASSFKNKYDTQGLYKNRDHLLHAYRKAKKRFSTILHEVVILSGEDPYQSEIVEQIKKSEVASMSFRNLEATFLEVHSMIESSIEESAKEELDRAKLEFNKSIY